MTINPFRFLGCVLMLFAGFMISLLNIAIGAATRASNIPVWTQTCTESAGAGKDSVKLVCPNGYTYSDKVDENVVAIIVPTQVVCRAYPLHTLFLNRLDTKCAK